MLPTAIPYRRSLEETTLGSRYAAALVPGDQVFNPHRAVLRQTQGYRSHRPLSID